MPTPGKPGIDPQHLSSQFDSNAVPLQNASFKRFKQELETAGVLVFDPATALADAKRTADHPELYLRTDTHWTPTGMEIVAKQLSEFILSESLLPKKPSTGYRQKAVDVTNLGDITVMLRLPRNQKLFPPETMTIHQITDHAGKMWQSDTASDDAAFRGQLYETFFHCQN